MKTTMRMLAGVGVAVLLLPNGRNAAAQAKDAASKDVLVFAAASMKPVIDKLAPDFKSKQGAKFSVSYGSSSALAQQIDSGAPADVFITADPVWAGKLEESGHSDKRVDFLGNSLVLVVPANAGSAVKRPEDLMGDAVKHIATGDPASVPVGK